MKDSTSVTPLTRNQQWALFGEMTKRKRQKEAAALRHISLVEPPEGSNGERIGIHLNEPLTEPEKTLWRRFMFNEHDDWFVRAYWSSDLRVRITIRTTDSAVLALIRPKVGSLVDDTLHYVIQMRKK
jgi:hypothetical protein